MQRGVVVGFSSEAELRAQQPPVLPDRERQQGRARDLGSGGTRQQRQQQAQQQQARTAANELSVYELQRDANMAENKRKLHELFGPLEVVGPGLREEASLRR